MLTLSIEQGKSRQETMRELIAAGLNGADLKETILALYPPSSKECIEVTKQIEFHSPPQIMNTDRDEMVNNFISERLERHDRSCLEFTRVNTEFEVWFQDKHNHLPSDVQMQTLTQTLGSVRKTTMRRRAWTDAVGYAPGGSSEPVAFRGFSGWRLITPASS